MSSEIDHSIPPQSVVEENIKFLKVEHEEFPNQGNLFSISEGLKEVIKIEFLFDAGSRFQPKPLVATATNNLLKNGTANKKQLEINHEIEKYGAFIENSITHDQASISLYSLNKYLPKVIPSVKEMLFDSDFPDEEISKYLRHQQQNFLVNQQKVSYLANSEFKKNLFGEDHPYGQTLRLEDFEKLQRVDLLEFHKTYYNKQKPSIFASGYVGKEQKSIIREYFGHDSIETNDEHLDWEKKNNELNKRIYIEKSDAVQSAIKLGKLLFTKEHPDFIGMQVLSTVLGGYFGSRLMRNIREDKGYTYGIGSGMISLLHEGYFVIGTEVGADVTKLALDEIYKELEILQQEKISEKELELVKNYTFGKLMRSFDGAFQAMDKFIAVHSYGYTYDYYRRKFQEISQITSSRLLSLAREYLKTEELLEVVVGKR